MSVESILSQKLFQLKYVNKQPAQTDLLVALKQFNELHPEQKMFTLPDGKSSLLLTLTGTIPVHFQGAQYNIPICIYLLPGHPYVAPLVFVEPTSTMMIKAGRHVDDKGRVYLPYLSEWKYPQYDTQGLIGTLCGIFGERPPVYSKVSNYQPPVSQQYPSTGYPTSQGVGMPLSGGGMPLQLGSHPLPSGGMALQGGGMHVPGGGMPMPGGGMPMPGGSMPMSGGSMPMPGGGMPMPGGPMHMPGGYGGPYPSASSGFQAPYPGSSAAGLNPYPRATSSLAPYESTLTNSNMNEGLTGRLPSRQQTIIPDETLRLSLLTAVEDKLRNRVQEVFEMGKHEIDDLETTRRKLEQGNKSLHDIIAKISTEQKDIESNIRLLKQKNVEMEETIRRMEGDSDNMNIDEAVISIAPLYNQILQLYAEENAIEDAIYFLNEALRKDVIDLELFQKTVRQCSRNQFILRATLLKARKAAGLADASGL